MKKIVAFVGSARKQHTLEAVGRFLDHLRSLGGVECEVVALSGHRIDTCRGCKSCFAKGEESCPLKDDRDLLLAKMMDSDGVVFATPNYSFQVSGFMKVFLDRLGFVFHRPRFFGKTFTAIVTQGVYGGGQILKYLDFAGRGLGFTTVKGTCHTAFEPMTERERRKMDLSLAAQAGKFHKQLMRPEPPVPSLFWLMGFRMPRTSMRLELNDSSYDYRYFRDKGWFESDYFYPTRLGPLKRAAGRLFDLLQEAMTRRKKRCSGAARGACPEGLRPGGMHT